MTNTQQTNIQQTLENISWQLANISSLYVTTPGITTREDKQNELTALSDAYYKLSKVLYINTKGHSIATASRDNNSDTINSDESFW